MEKKLSVREQLFVAAYMAHQNAAQAARDAGYSPKNVDVMAHKVMQRPRVIKAISEARQRITHKYDVRAERVVQEMATIGFSDIRHYIIDGKPVAEGVGLAPGAPDQAMRAIKKLKVKTRTVPQASVVEHEGEENETAVEQPPIVEREVEFEFWSKDSQLKNLGDYLKLFEPGTPPPGGDEKKLSPEELRARAFAILRVALDRKRAGKKPKSPKAVA